MTLPNFILGGAPKTGTTSLFHYLASHPDVFMPTWKEPHFFTVRWDKGWEFYEDLFKDAKGQKAIGEGSTWYMHSDHVPERIQERIDPKKLKLIFGARHPIDRAESHYWYNIADRRLDPSLSFSERIRNPEGQARFLVPGLYADNLERWERFFPRENIMVFLFDDLKKDRAGVVRSIFEFLGVDPSFEPPLEKTYNVTEHIRNPGFMAVATRTYRALRKVPGVGPAMDLIPGTRKAFRKKLFEGGKGPPKPISEEDRQYLRAFFKDSNARLSERLGRDLAHWDQ